MNPEKPAWLKVKLPSHRNFFLVADLLKTHGLNTICRSAGCPNITECWMQRTATFLILGNVCTRSCAFCAVPKGNPSPPAADEPRRLSEAVASLGLDYAVITSVARDDLSDGGAAHFASAIRAVRRRNPGVKVEVLIPDFQGDETAISTVIEEKPDILNHNLETIESLYPRINRPKENYRRSLQILKKAKDMGAATKSGLMVGLGEEEDDLLQAFSDLRAVGCDLLTIGQYLRPSSREAPLKEYYTPQEFARLKKAALAMGFQDVESGPLVRSSYQAHKLYRSLAKEVNVPSCAI